MKINKLRFKNLNSLYGEWEIDFTKDDYISDGIFAITGATGAGKSTILDAICLALYGRTPRLDKVNKSTNDIMSRQTGECMAEVTFQTQQGHYRCTWSQHTSRKKPGAALQDAKHEIVDASSDAGKVIEAKKSLTLKVIEEKVGMDFERFTRSALLAQGGFAAFLQASADERSPILEQITGTAIYSDISINVHKRYREEADKLKRLEDKNQSIHSLDEEQLATLKEEKQQQEQQLTTIKQQQQQNHAALQWQQQLKQWQEEQEKLTQEQATLQQAIHDFEPDKQRLDRALKASQLDINYAELEHQRQHHIKQQQKIDGLLQAIPLAKQASEAEQKSLQSATNQLEQFKQAFTKEQAVIQQVRELDTQRGSEDKIYQTQRADDEKLTQQLADQNQQKATAIEQQQQQQSELTSLTDYIEQHQSDETLSTTLSGITEQAKNWQQSQQQYTGFAKALSDLQQALSTTEQAYKQQQEEVAKLEHQHRVVQETIQQTQTRRDQRLAGKVLSDVYAEQHYTRQQGDLLQQIHSLEQQNKQLMNDSAALKQQQKQTTDEKQQINKQLDTLEQYFNDHQYDENLALELVTLKATVGHYQTSQQHYQRYTQDANKLQQTIDHADQAIAQQQKHCQQLDEQLQGAKQQRHALTQAYNQCLEGKLVREYRAEYDTYLKEREYINKIASLEQERDRLEDGKPCPLCGSEHHPFALGNQPVLHEVDAKIKAVSQRLAQIEAYDQQLDQHQQHETQLNDTFSQANTQLTQQQHDKATLQVKQDGIKQQQNQEQVNYQTHYQALTEQVSAFAMTLPSDAQGDDSGRDHAALNNVITTLTERAALWQQHQHSKQTLDKQLIKVDALQQQLNDRINKQTQTLAEVQQAIDAKQQERHELDNTYQGTKPTLALTDDAKEGLSIIEQHLQYLAQTLQQTENDDKTLKQAHSEEQNVDHQLRQAQDALKATNYTQQGLIKEQQDKQQQQQAAQQACDEVAAKLIEQLTPYGLTNALDGEALNTDALKPDQLASLLNNLQQRSQAWQSKQQQAQQLQQHLKSIAQTIEHIEQQLSEKQTQQSQQQTILQAQKQLCDELKTKRQDLYANKDPNSELEQLQAQQIQYEQLLETAQQAYNQADKTLHSLEQQYQDSQQALLEADRQLKQTKTDFLQQCARLGFADESVFNNSRLSLDERKALEQTQQDLQHKQQYTQQQLEQVKQQLASSLKQAITDLTLEQLTEQHQQFAEQQEQINTALGAIRQQLEAHDKAMQQFSEQTLLIEAQRKESNQWARLHSLIGSADGKKYRNFAQGLTFEIMVSHANQQLARMTDRYRLKRADDSPLELNVVDAYQAEEERPTRNLSGGESFIVSMALALGLSNMASRKVSVDSLFLDEGFGTLDADTLESALDALAGLHGEGKLIGIISHVGALQERITTQINVKRRSGGRSLLSGVGCRKVMREPA